MLAVRRRHRTQLGARENGEDERRRAMPRASIGDESRSHRHLAFLSPKRSPAACSRSRVCYKLKTRANKTIQFKPLVAAANMRARALDAARC